MNDNRNASIVQGYLRDCTTRIGLSCAERTDEVQYTLQSYLTAGSKSRSENDFERAEHLFQETIKMATNEFEDLVPEQALASYLLSSLYLDQSELDAAEAFAVAAIDASTELFGANHPATGLALHQLGEVQSAQNKSEALSSHKKASNILSMNYLNLSTNLFLSHDAYDAQLAC